MKNYPKQSPLVAAVAAAIGLGLASSSAIAVNHTDTGLGEVGMVSYYTARNNIDTQISLTNTSDTYVVAVKLRFREADNTRDARDFNIFLSPNDVWTGVVTMGEDGETPLIRTFDTSCTAPQLPASSTVDGAREIGFTNSDYISESGDENLPWDSGDQTIVRTQDGHIEVFVMGVDVPEADAGPEEGDQPNLAYYAVHSPAGTTPRDCSKIREDYLDTGGATLADEFDEPLNVLKTAANLIRVDKGVAAGLPVDTLANFYNPGCEGVPPGQEDVANPCPDNIMVDPGSPFPNLSFARPAESSQITGFGGITDFFVEGTADAVSSLFMATSVLNEYAIGGASLAETDWVITFPTKNFYVDIASLASNQEVPAPFLEFFQKFNAEGTQVDGGQSCVGVKYSENIYDREEASDTVESELDFSPRPPGTPGDSICQETQVLQFGETGALGARNVYGVPLPDGFTSGWMRLQFTSGGQQMPPALTLFGTFYEYEGLPVTGFSLKTLENGVSSSQGLLNYGIVQEHAYDRVIMPFGTMP